MRLATLIVLAGGTLAGCASTGAVPAPFPRPDRVSPAPATSSPVSAPIPPDAEAIVRAALSLRGAPYRDGGGDPSGFDCSGLVTYVYGLQGRALPRTVAEQFRFGVAVRAIDVAPGDLVFFRVGSRGPSHVGIAISRDEFVHAPARSGTVRVESLRSGYWSARLVGARRLPWQAGSP